MSQLSLDYASWLYSISIKHDLQVDENEKIVSLLMILSLDNNQVVLLITSNLVY